MYGLNLEPGIHWSSKSHRKDAIPPIAEAILLAADVTSISSMADWEEKPRKGTEGLGGFSGSLCRFWKEPEVPTFVLHLFLIRTLSLVNRLNKTLTATVSFKNGYGRLCVRLRDESPRPFDQVLSCFFNLVQNCNPGITFRRGQCSLKHTFG
ncbi:hypothetical protein VNO77_34301 [Canavalia gladiata]|uniref:Uncharacterized protein n=1 Tax=Canavalia gladiata TaxID=3824 RepID=A0AAN9KFY1_CANGL